MNPRIVSVRPGEAFTLLLTFNNGEKRLFDASSYLRYPAFERLRERAYFSLAIADGGTVRWPDGTDLCPDTLYLESELVDFPEGDVPHL